MKPLHRNIALFFILVILIYTSFILFIKLNEDVNEGALWENYTVVEYELEGSTKRLIVADSPVQWQKGLMYVRKPIWNIDGMIFIFPEADMHSFWNKNTFMDLTLYWIKDGKVIGKSNLPSIEKSKEIVQVVSPGPADTVIEIY